MANRINDRTDRITDEVENLVKLGLIAQIGTVKQSMFYNSSLAFIIISSASFTITLSKS